MIIRDANFINKIETHFKFKIPKEIEEIAIDYTLTRNLQFILEKLEKGYQTEHRFLIIVLMGHTSTSVISQVNAILSQGARSGYPWVQNVKILTGEEFFFDNLGIPKGGIIAQRYDYYNRVIKECFTSHFAQTKLDILWDLNLMVQNLFKGIGQTNLNKFLGVP